MNILLTGSDGSIGRDIENDFKNKKNFKIFLISNKKRNDNFKKNENIVIQDLKKKIKLLKYKIDVVIHCANKHYNSPGKGNFYNENIRIAKNLSHFCNKSKVKKLIFLSSIDVYGKPKKNNKIYDENSKLNPENWYAKSKIVSEKIFSRKKNLYKSIILRIPGILSTSTNKDFPILSKIVNYLIEGRQIVINNASKKFNNVLDTKEISKIILKLIKKDFKSNKIYNLSANYPTKFIDIVKILKKNLNSKSDIIKINKKKKIFFISNKKIQKDLNFNILPTREIIKRYSNNKIKYMKKLAINGGKKLRSKPMPSRKIFGQDELKMVKSVFHRSWKSKVDFGFEGYYEKKFTQNFCKFQGGGYADAVSSGGAAVFIALKSLDLKPGSHVIVSPVCNPGGIMPIAVQDVKMIIPDSNPHEFNISPNEFEKNITNKTQAAVITHLGGFPADMDPICKIAKKNNIKIIEDCSQAHGALYKGKKVGTFGDISAFSNGFSKTLAAGGTAGLVYTKNKELYWKARSIADRGKPLYKKNFNFRNTTDFLFPSNNYNSDELTCAIGMSVLKKLPLIIKKRDEIAKKIDKGLTSCLAVKPTSLRKKGIKPSIFFHTLKVDLQKISVSKIKFAKAIESEGIPINSDYRDITCEWKWIPKYVKNFKSSLNALNFRDSTFNLLLNEKYNEKDIQDIISCIKKVERFYLK